MKIKEVGNPNDLSEVYVITSTDTLSLNRREP